MTAVAVHDGCDLRKLKAHLEKQLPEYARPVFIRIVSSIDLTGTLKLNKQLLATQSFDPNQSQDPLYYVDRNSGAFLPLTVDVFRQLQAGLQRI